jgi:hypothetical protein
MLRHMRRTVGGRAPAVPFSSYSTATGSTWAFNSKNTLMYPVPRVYAGRENFKAIDDDREAAIRLVQQKYNISFNSRNDIEHVKFLGERAWAIRDKQLTASYVEKVHETLSKFKNIQTLTSLCCLSEDISMMLSVKYPGVRFIGMSLPLSTSYPVSVVKYKDGQIQLDSKGNMVYGPVTQEHIRIFTGGVRLVGEESTGLIKFMLESEIYS